MKKVDILVRDIVIDWLQYGEKMDEDRAQNTLTLIHDLEAQLRRAVAVMEGVLRVADRKTIEFDAIRDFLKEMRE